MKRFFLWTVLLLATVTVSAQEGVNFFDLTKNFDWKMTETEFKVKYHDMIVNSNDTIPDIHAATGSWLLKNIKLVDSDVTTLVGFKDDGTANSISAVIKANKQDSENTLLISKIKLFNIVFLGISDMKLEDADFNQFGWGQIGVEKGDITMWQWDTVTYMQLSGESETESFFAICAAPPIPRDPDFRKGYWGDSMNTIKEKEGKTDEFNIENAYAFYTYVAGLRCICAYRFVNDKFTTAKYIFLNNNSDNCIDNYNLLVQLLSKKYGDPSKSLRECEGSDTEQKLYSEGELVRLGKLELGSLWFSSRSTVYLYLKGEQRDIKLNIEYGSEKYSKEREQATLQDL